MTSVEATDSLVKKALISLAADRHVSTWRAKEHNWVNYFVFRHLLPRCKRSGVDPAQLAIEMPVPQPNGEGLRYTTKTVRRDIVIWPTAGCTCWDDDWHPTCHPLAILEWKVHRPKRRNRDDQIEWLKDYCHWKPSVIGYGVEVHLDRDPMAITCCRFLGDESEEDWLERNLEPPALVSSH